MDEQSSIEFDMGMEAGDSVAAEVRFSSSSGFQQAESAMEDQNKEFFDTTTMCSELYATYEKTAPVVFKAGFAKALKELLARPFQDCHEDIELSNCPDDFKADYSFFQTFGTAVTTSSKFPPWA